MGKIRLVKLKEKIKAGTIERITKSESVQNAAVTFALRTKAKASARFWPRWYVLTLCNDDYTKYDAIKVSPEIKNMRKSELTFEMINWDDPIVELELFMCDPGNLLNLSDPEKRDDALAVLSDDAQRFYWSDIPAPGNNKPYYEVYMSSRSIRRGAREYKKSGTVADSAVASQILEAESDWEKDKAAKKTEPEGDGENSDTK